MGLTVEARHWTVRASRPLDGVWGSMGLSFSAAVFVPRAALPRSAQKLPRAAWCEPFVCWLSREPFVGRLFREPCRLFHEPFVLLSIFIGVGDKPAAHESSQTCHTVYHMR